MQGILPEPVRCRRDKACFDDLFVKSLRERSRTKVEALLNDPLCVERGYVEKAKIRALLEGSGNSKGWSGTRDLNTVLSLEIWLNTLTQFRPAAIAQQRSR
jgi:hypothetical protein